MMGFSFCKRMFKNLAFKGSCYLYLKNVFYIHAGLSNARSNNPIYASWASASKNSHLYDRCASFTARSVFKKMSSAHS